MDPDDYWRNIFSPFFDPLLVPKWPIFKGCWTFYGHKWLKRGLKWAYFICLRATNGPRSFLEKHVLTHFGPLGKPEQMFLACFEPMAAPFGPPKISKCLENGPFWDLESFLKKFICSPHWSPLTNFGIYPLGFELAACCSLVGKWAAVWGSRRPFGHF